MPGPRERLLHALDVLEGRASEVKTDYADQPGPWSPSTWRGWFSIKTVTYGLRQLRSAFAREFRAEAGSPPLSDMLGSLARFSFPRYVLEEGGVCGYRKLRRLRRELVAWGRAGFGGRAEMRAGWM